MSWTTVRPAWGRGKWSNFLLAPAVQEPRLTAPNITMPMVYPILWHNEEQYNQARYNKGVLYQVFIIKVEYITRKTKPVVQIAYIFFCNWICIPEILTFVEWLETYETFFLVMVSIFPSLRQKASYVHSSDVFTFFFPVLDQFHNKKDQNFTLECLHTSSVTTCVPEIPRLNECFVTWSNLVIDD